MEWINTSDNSRLKYSKDECEFLNLFALCIDIYIHVYGWLQFLNLECLYTSDSEKYLGNKKTQINSRILINIFPSKISKKCLELKEIKLILMFQKNCLCLPVAKIKSYYVNIICLSLTHPFQFCRLVKYYLIWNFPVLHYFFLCTRSPHWVKGWKWQFYRPGWRSIYNQELSVTTNGAKRRKFQPGKKTLFKNSLIL